MSGPPSPENLRELSAVLGDCRRTAAALAAVLERLSAWAERLPVGQAPDLSSGPSDSETAGCDSDHTVPDSLSAPSLSLVVRHYSCPKQFDTDVTL